MRDQFKSYAANAPSDCQSQDEVPVCLEASDPVEKHPKGRALPRRGSHVNVGAIDQPFSGVGLEFEPLNGKTAETNFVLHEVGYWGGNYNWNFTSVFSPFWRLIYDFKRGHCIRFGDRETYLDPDQMLLIPSYRQFTCEGDAPVPTLWVAFSLDRQVELGQTMPIVIPKNDVIAALTQELQGLFHGRRPDRREVIQQTAISCVLYVLTRPEIHWQAALPEPIADILALIQKDLAANWTNETLARAAHMSTGVFIRSFRQWVHDTPSKYVQKQRIRKACALLVSSDRSIKQIAADVGFANRYHFSRIFKICTGVSPAQYQQQASSGRVG